MADAAEISACTKLRRKFRAVRYNLARNHTFLGLFFDGGSRYSGAGVNAWELVFLVGLFMLIVALNPPKDVTVCLQDEWSKGQLNGNLNYGIREKMYDKTHNGCYQQPYARNATYFTEHNLSSFTDTYTSNERCGVFTDGTGNEHQCCCCHYSMSDEECGEATLHNAMYATNGLCVPAGVTCPNTTVDAEFLANPKEQVFDFNAGVFETKVQRDCTCHEAVEKHARERTETMLLGFGVVAFPLEMAVGLVLAAAERKNSCFSGACNLWIVRIVSKLLTFILFLCALISGLTSDFPFHFLGDVAWELWVMFTLEIYQLVLFLWFAEAAGDLRNPYQYVLYSKGCDHTETAGMVVSTAIVLGATIGMEILDANIAMQVWTAIGGAILIWTAIEDVHFPAKASVISAGGVTEQALAAESSKKKAIV